MKILVVRYPTTGIIHLLPADDIFLARLLDLNDDRNDEQDDDQTARYSNDCEVSVVQRIQDASLSLL